MTVWRIWKLGDDSATTLTHSSPLHTRPGPPTGFNFPAITTQLPRLGAHEYQKRSKVPEASRPIVCQVAAAPSLASNLSGSLSLIAMRGRCTDPCGLLDTDSRFEGSIWNAIPGSSYQQGHASCGQRGWEVSSKAPWIC